MQQLRIDLLRELNQAREAFSNSQLVTQVALFTGTEKIWAICVIFLVSIELLVFVIFLPLHRKLLNHLEQTKKGLVQQIDEIIYALAKTQYAAHISRKVLGGDPHMALMKELFKSGSFEYFNTISIIKENLGKVELLLGKPVSTPEQRAAVETYQKKMKKLISLTTGIGSFITLFTLGLYRLFR